MTLNLRLNSEIEEDHFGVDKESFRKLVKDLYILVLSYIKKKVVILLWRLKFDADLHFKF